MGNSLTRLSPRHHCRPQADSIDLPASSTQRVTKLAEPPHVDRPPVRPMKSLVSNAASLPARLDKIAKKTTPYNAKRLNAETQLNGVVRVHPEAGHTLKSETVYCRHFVKAFVEYAGRKRSLMQEFLTSQKITSRFEHRLREMDVASRRVRKLVGADSKHVVRDAQLGQYLAAVASALAKPPAGGRSEANCLLESSCHAMALYVSRKSRDGTDYFSAKLYDPNNTASYRRVEALSIDSLRELTLKDMLITPALSEKYSDSHKHAVTLLAICLDPRLHPRMDRSLTEVSPDAMHLALSDGSLEDQHVMLASLDSKNIGLAQHSLFEVLRAKSVYSGWTGLFGALAGGYADSASAFISFVLSASDLTERQKTELIAAKDSRGMPGLFAALSLGKTQAVSAYAGAVLADSGISNGDKFTLLASKNRAGKPGLFKAFEKGESEAVAAYAGAVLATSALTDPQKVELLTAHCASGGTGLAAAVANGATDTVEAFHQAVNTSNLSAADKRMLLNSQ